MWDDAKQLNAVAVGFALLAALLLLWGAFAWAVRQPIFAFHEVVVRGSLERVNPAYLEAAVRNELTGTLFTMNLENARASLSRLPWIRRVALRRQWPRRLELTIEEHAPFARWNDGGLVNVQGEVFIADYNGDLPRFDGPERGAAQVSARFREWSDALAPVALKIDTLRLSPRGGWHIDANGVAGAIAIELPHDEPTARLVHFVSIYERTIGALARARTHIAHVDLRYRNGFAARVPGFRERPPKKAAA